MSNETIQVINGATLVADFEVFDDDDATVPHSFDGYTVSLRYGSPRVDYSGPGLTVAGGTISVRLGSDETASLQDGWCQIVATNDADATDVQLVFDGRFDVVGRVR